MFGRPQAFNWRGGREIRIVLPKRKLDSNPDGHPNGNSRILQFQPTTAFSSLKASTRLPFCARKEAMVTVR
jgi:hypothetical protein